MTPYALTLYFCITATSQPVPDYVIYIAVWGLRRKLNIKTLARSYDCLDIGAGAGPRVTCKRFLRSVARSLRALYSDSWTSTVNMAQRDRQHPARGI